MKKTISLLLILFASLAGRAQITNADFESWSTGATPWAYPTGWPEMNGLLCYRDSVAQHGKYALQVSVWYYYTKTIAWHAEPVSWRPYALRGFYKYTNDSLNNLGTGLVPDTALSTVWVTRWNATMADRDTIGKGSLEMLGSDEYRYFEVLINYTDAGAADSFWMAFDPSALKRTTTSNYNAGTSDGYCSFLSIDNLSLAAAPSFSGLPVANPVIGIYPNPAGDYVRIEGNLGSYAVAISDMQGRTLVTSKSDRIYIGHLVPGTYVVSVLNEEGKLLKSEQVVKR